MRVEVRVVESMMFRVTRWKATLQQQAAGSVTPPPPLLPAASPRPPQACTTLQAQPGLLELLSFLKASGVKVGLITRNTVESVDAFFRVIGEEWRDAFDLVLTRDNTPHVKPDPRSLLVFAEVGGCAGGCHWPGLARVWAAWGWRLCKPALLRPRSGITPSALAPPVPCRPGARSRLRS